MVQSVYSNDGKLHKELLNQNTAEFNVVMPIGMNTEGSICKNGQNKRYGYLTNDKKSLQNVSKNDLLYQAYDAYKKANNEHINQDYDDFIGSYIAVNKNDILLEQISIHEELNKSEYDPPNQILTRWQKDSGVGNIIQNIKETDSKSYIDIETIDNSKNASPNRNRSENCKTNTNLISPEKSFYKKRGKNFYIKNPDVSMEIGFMNSSIYNKFDTNEYVKKKVKMLQKERNQLLLHKPIKPLNDLARKMDIISKPNILNNMSIRPQLKDFINNKLAPDIIQKKLEEFLEDKDEKLQCFMRNENQIKKILLKQSNIEDDRTRIKTAIHSKIRKKNIDKEEYLKSGMYDSDPNFVDKFNASLLEQSSRDQGFAESKSFIDNVEINDSENISLSSKPGWDRRTRMLGRNPLKIWRDTKYLEKSLQTTKTVSLNKKSRTQSIDHSKLTILNNTYDHHFRKMNPLGLTPLIGRKSRMMSHHNCREESLHSEQNCLSERKRLTPLREIYYGKNNLEKVQKHDEYYTKRNNDPSKYSYDEGATEMNENLPAYKKRNSINIVECESTKIDPNTNQDFYKTPKNTNQTISFGPIPDNEPSNQNFDIFNQNYSNLQKKDKENFATDKNNFDLKNQSKERKNFTSHNPSEKNTIFSLSKKERKCRTSKATRHATVDQTKNYNGFIYSTDVKGNIQVKYSMREDKMLQGLNPGMNDDFVSGVHVEHTEPNVPKDARIRVNFKTTSCDSQKDDKNRRLWKNQIPSRNNYQLDPKKYVNMGDDYKNVLDKTLNNQDDLKASDLESLKENDMDYLNYTIKRLLMKNKDPKYKNNNTQKEQIAEVMKDNNDKTPNKEMYDIKEFIRKKRREIT